MRINRRRDRMNARGELILNSVVETQRTADQSHEDR